ncbi:ATP-binding protein [Paenibacillus sp. BR2-3]|uniref:ATP-binding protein n=1 Tax=Paenibacillus sp. BR2-3 TaxID=3048494 RepID=UPI0039774974
MESIHKEVSLYGIEHHQGVIDTIIRELRIEACAFDVKLILVEAVMNAHYHGNQSDSAKPIMIRYSVRNRCLNIQVEDCGEGFKQLIFPDEIKNEHLLDEGGRGLYLIRCLSDNVKMIQNTIHINKTLTYP